MTEDMIRFDHVSYRYDDASEDALHDIDLTIPKGQFVAVLGRNGSGKSTLGRLIDALLLPTAGSVTVHGIRSGDDASCLAIRRYCGTVFQNPDNQIVSTIVEEDCAFGPENLGIPPIQIRERVDRALRTVGMQEHALSSPQMLSGGQKQRVAIAGVLAMEPEIIVFDESTSMLDPSGRSDILMIAHRLHREQKTTVIWITHFMEEAEQAERVLILDQGSVAADGTPEQLFFDPGKMHSLGLRLPESVRLCEALTAGGLALPHRLMSADEMAVEICRSLK